MKIGTILPSSEMLKKGDAHYNELQRKFAPLHEKARTEAVRVTTNHGQTQYWTSDTEFFEIGNLDGKRRNFEIRNGHEYAKR